jgi:predicted acetyltransferase
LYQAPASESYRRPIKKTQKTETSQATTEKVVTPEPTPEAQAPVVEKTAEPILQPSTDETTQHNINPKVPGRGKREHKYFQELIRNLGMESGYKAVVEAPLDEGGFVDVLLTRDDEQIACEVALNTANSYEIHNIQKSLDSGIAIVVVISNKPKHLKAIEERAKSELSKQQFSQVRFISPELLPEILQKKEEAVERVRGYKVKVKRTIPSAEEIKSKREKVAAILAG